MKKRLHLWISGKVQGVFFRAHTEKMAHSLNLKGWVKNLPDSRVETVAEGEEADLKKFLDWCHHGPPAARVTKVDIQWAEATGEFKAFEVI